MNRLIEKFTSLKKSIAGNREKTGYEFTFGMTREEQWRVTPPNKTVTRIISELDFGIRLSGANDNVYDDILESAVDYLIDGVKKEGAVTLSAAEEAEKMLLPMAGKAKEYKLILAAHAHIDMNWMWSWHETVAITLATFRTMLDLMDEYPHFCYSQSQASVYKIVEDYDPEMMERIKKRIAEGRWEITAAAWVETDKNMPNTESLLRHIKYTRDYLKEHWGINPDSIEVDFSPDTFGHSAQIPEINSFGNVKYYYHCRGTNSPNILYKWKAPSGSEILMYREQYWYNSGITPHMGIGLIEISKRCAGLKTGLIVYGVGDHGGGPTRRDVEEAIEMSQWKIFPTIKFGTIREFFKEAESVRDLVPTVDHELNFIFDGCYTTQSRIKRANRHCEAALTDSTAFSAIASAYLKKNYPYKQYMSAWQNVLFTHFHDILTGSCVQDSREYAMGRYSEAMAAANTGHLKALNAIAENIDTSMIPYDADKDIIASSQSEGAGAGYGTANFKGVPSPERGVGKTRVFHVFNPSAHERFEPAEITVWDWPGDMRYVKVEDAAGTPLAFAMLDGGPQRYWDHQYFRVLVSVRVPAFGYTTVVLNENSEAQSSYPFYYQPVNQTLGCSNAYILENSNIKAEFDMQTCALISLIDKRSGMEMIKSGESAGLVYIDSETNGMSAWSIGKYLKTEPVTDVGKSSLYSNGKLRQGLRFEANIKSSSVSVDISLDEGAEALKYAVKVTWNEAGNGRTIPLLVFKLPHAYDTGVSGYLCDIPAGSIIRMAGNHDIPALQYTAAINSKGRSVSIITDSKYGYRAFGGSLISTLINSAVNPDPYPERGIHNIKLAVAVTDACPKSLEEYATDFNHALTYVPVNPHKGSLPAGYSFVKLDECGAVVSSVDMTADGALMVRLYEDTGEETDVKLTFAKEISHAALIDLMECDTGTVPTVLGKTLKFKLGAHKIASVKVRF